MHNAGAWIPVVGVALAAILAGIGYVLREVRTTIKETNRALQSLVTNVALVDERLKRTDTLEDVVRSRGETLAILAKEVELHLEWHKENRQEQAKGTP